MAMTRTHPPKAARTEIVPGRTRSRSAFARIRRLLTVWLPMGAVLAVAMGTGLIFRGGLTDGWSERPHEDGEAPWREMRRTTSGRMRRLLTVYVPAGALLVGTICSVWTLPRGRRRSRVPMSPWACTSGRPIRRASQPLLPRTGTHPVIASDYLPGGPTWGAMVDAGELSWLLGPWESSGYQLVLGVPIIPSDSSGNPLGTLAGGAAGDYDSYFATLAQTLVSHNEGNAILRLGWEFNGNWFAWAVTNSQDALNYAAYYRNIVQTMRSVSGASFRFVWDGAGGSPYGENYTVAQTYPGSAYVDFIGQDVYDQTWDSGCQLSLSNVVTITQSQCVWNNDTLPSLQQLSSFATSVGKPAVLPEWGVAIRSDGHGLGDDPTFIDGVASWAANNNVAWTSYFDYNDNPDSVITDGNFPNALAAFGADFGGAASPLPGLTTTTTPPTTTTTVTATPEAPAGSGAPGDADRPDGHGVGRGGEPLVGQPAGGLRHRPARRVR